MVQCEHDNFNEGIEIEQEPKKFTLSKKYH